MSSRPFLRGLAGALVVVAVIAVVAAAVVKTQTGASLKSDSRALARIDVGSLGGSISGVRATGPGGPIRLTVDGDRISPTGKVAPGEKIRVDVTVSRPGSVSWAVGKTHTESLTVTTPAATVASRWVKVDSGGSVHVAFTSPVQRVSYLVGHQTSQRTLRTSLKTLSLGNHGATGTLKIAAVSRSWERLPKPSTVTWFPDSSQPVAVVSPKPGGQRGSAQPIKLTFSDTVEHVLGAQRPTLTPKAAGHWRKLDSHTLQFVPTGYGAGFGAKVALKLPKTIGVAGPDGTGLQRTNTIAWTTPPGSTTRLQQLLADGGYLPLKWSPDGADVALTKSAQSQAATVAPKGAFSWKYDNTPPELKKLWTPGKIDVITRGAIMKFQNEHGLTADAIAGPAVWRALLDDTIKGKRNNDPGYSYVYVHRNVPQRLTLWHNGHTVLTSPGNTGVPAAPTELGTFPVFEHLEVTTMSGTNPDGSTYNDPGIKWVSYFNGGDALHTFNRASFGTPQSLGCVELPESTAKRVWPYTPIGTLVTIED